MSTMQRFGLLDLLQDLDIVLASMMDIFKMVKQEVVSRGRGGWGWVVDFLLSR